MAIGMVKSRHVTIYTAAMPYRIPKAAICKHVNGLRGVQGHKIGQPTTLPFEVEKKNC
jgi:hypothetical protein